MILSNLAFIMHFAIPGCWQRSKTGGLLTINF